MPRSKAHGHRRRGPRIARRVASGIAAQDIRPCATIERVVPLPAFQRIVAIVSVERVCAVIAPEAVIVGTTVEGISAIGSPEPVIASLTPQDVVPGIAIENIPMRRSGEVLDVAEGVAFGIPAGIGCPRDKAHGYRRRGPFITRRVGTGAAVQCVSPRAADQAVIAAPGREGIRARASGKVVPEVVAGQAVIMRRSGEVLDVAEGVAFCIPAGIGCPRSKAYGHRRRGPFITRRVGAGAAVQCVRPRAADQAVIAAPGREGIRARASGKVVPEVVAGQAVIMRRSGEVLDIAEGVAFCVPACIGCPRDKAHGHRRRGPFITRRVGAGAAVQCVSPRAADQAVIAAPGREGIRARASGKVVPEVVAGQAVIMRRSGEVLDVAEGVAFCIPACIGCPRDKAHGHRRRGPFITRRVGAGAAVQCVRPCAADQRIVARAPVERVRARASGKVVPEVVAGQAVIMRRSGEVLDIAEGVAFCVPACIGCPRDKAHGHRRGPFVAQVGAGAAVQCVSPCAADQAVAAPGREGIRARTSGKVVPEVLPVRLSSWSDPVRLEIC